MSILIKDMEMPESCNDCIFDTWGLCLINANLEGKDEHTHSCPLVPVPEHGRLIDADVAIRYLFAILGPVEAPKASGVIAGMPTIIPADPVEVDNG